MQPTVSRSSTEAEYKALAVATSEILWLSYLLQDLHAPPSLTMVLHCDNIGATYMTSNPVLHARTKHIEVDYHFVRDLVVKGALKVQFPPSTSQPADIFTKSLPAQTFLRHISKLLPASSISLQGNDK